MSKMYKHKRVSGSFIASTVAIIALALLLTDPFDMTMNNMALVAVSGLLLASFGVFAGLFWQERAADEREAVIIDKAGRLGYLSGLCVLVIALVVQSFDHAVDSWLIVTIAVMLLSKHFYIQIKK